MLREYYEVDEVTGVIISNHVLNDETDTIPFNYVLGWGDAGLHQPVYDWEAGTWVEGKTADQFLIEAKQRKDKELNRACSEAILAGFSHTINGQTYWFSFDTEAQLNFQGAERILAKGLVAEIPWTVRIGDSTGDYTRINITPAIMDELQMVILLHKTNNISKYRDVLMPQVINATTVEEVEAIVW